MFEKMYEDDEKNAELLSMVIRELTGDFVSYIPCEEIQKEGRRFND